MEYIIRKIKQEETKVLDTFLYEAIFIPEGVEAPPREIINQPELRVYVDGFGSRAGDIAFVAESNGIVVGAVWVRIMDDYGHIDDETPSFAISLLKEYRNYGIGTELMKTMLHELRDCGYKQSSLAVQKASIPPDGGWSKRALGTQRPKKRTSFLYHGRLSCVNVYFD